MESFDHFMARQEGGSPVALPGSTQVAPVAASARPPYWVDGDPMNDTQAYLKGQGKPLYVIASVADNPPPANVLNALIAAVNPAAVLPTTSPGVVNPPEAPKYAPATPSQMPPLGATPGQVAPAISMPSLPAITMPSLPGTVAAPAITMPKVVADEVQDAYTGMTREALKALAIQRGLLDDSSKMREDSIRTLLRNQEGMSKAYEGAASNAMAAPTRVLPRAPEVTRPVTGERPKNLGVYVGCIQLGLSMVALPDFLAPILEKVTAQTGLPHWNLEDYGKGGARLAGAVEQWLLHHPDYDGSIFVDTRSAEAAHVLPVLLRYAEITVRATF
jgi:hypothetical protein